MANAVAWLGAFACATSFQVKRAPGCDKVQSSLADLHGRETSTFQTDQQIWNSPNRTGWRSTNTRDIANRWVFHVLALFGFPPKPTVCLTWWKHLLFLGKHNMHRHGLQSRFLNRYPNKLLTKMRSILPSIWFHFVGRLASRAIIQLKWWPGPDQIIYMAWSNYHHLGFA